MSNGVSPGVKQAGLVSGYGTKEDQGKEQIYLRCL